MWKFWDIKQLIFKLSPETWKMDLNLDQWIENFVRKNFRLSLTSLNVWLQHMIGFSGQDVGVKANVEGLDNVSWMIKYAISEDWPKTEKLTTYSNLLLLHPYREVF